MLRKPTPPPPGPGSGPPGGVWGCFLFKMFCFLLTEGNSQSEVHIAPRPQGGVKTVPENELENDPVRYPAGNRLIAIPAAGPDSPAHLFHSCAGRWHVVTALVPSREEWGVCPPPWGVWRCLETFRLSPLARGCYCHLVEARDAAKHPTMHRCPRGQETQAVKVHRQEALLERHFYCSKDYYVTSEKY